MLVEGSYALNLTPNPHSPHSWALFPGSEVIFASPLTLVIIALSPDPTEHSLCSWLSTLLILRRFEVSPQSLYCLTLEVWRCGSPGQEEDGDTGT